MLEKTGRYVRVGSVNEIPVKGGRLVRIGNDDIALFQVKGDVVAVTNVCPHQKFSKIHEGQVENGRVTCPMHGWTFDLQTGNAVNGNGRLKKYNVRVDGNEVWVENQEDE